tara:strand:+ start:716 stop:1786 length:1071 start_codon:yes stop_codon:yes gene_type:complete
MAQRGRPRKKTTVKDVVEDVKVEAVEQKVAEPVVEEPIVKEVAPKTEKTEDIYDLNTKPAESRLGDSYNPFGESVEQRTYSRPQVAANVSDIDEPVFTKPSYAELVDRNETEADESVAPEDKEPEGLGRFSQPEINDMPDNAKDEAADGLVDITLNLYGMGCKGLGSLAKISDKKLDRLESEDLIDTSLRVPVDAHTTASVRQIVDSMNSQVEESFTVTDDFKEQIKPVMKRVFVKRGWGMTDEQTLMMMFGMDIAQKVGVAMQIKSSANYQLEAFMQMHEQNKMQNEPNEYVVADEPTPEPRRRRPTPTDSKDEAPTTKEAPKDKKEDTSSMVKSQNPDLKVNMTDLAQVDVDNV